jgi:hypothetical protein
MAALRKKGMVYIDTIYMLVFGTPFLLHIHTHVLLIVILRYYYIMRVGGYV